MWLRRIGRRKKGRRYKERMALYRIIVLRRAKNTNYDYF